MKGKKTLIAEKERIIKAKLETPDASCRDLQKATGSNYNTARRVVKDIPVVTTSNMINKLDNIIDQIIQIQEISIGGFRDKAMEQKLSVKEVKDLSEIGKVNRERKRILLGEPTDITKIDFDLSNKSPKELDELRQKLLK